MRIVNLLFAGSLVVSLSGCGWSVPEEIETAYNELPEKIDFNYHVKPILSDKCFACHGPDENKQKADLRLDTPEGAYKSLANQEGGHAIVPSKPGKSYIVERMLSKDPEIQMPPPEFKVAMSEEEIATIAKWIEQGAEYKPHWSLIKPEKQKLPETDNTGWPQNAIDYFVLNTLEEKGLTPSGPAKKETIIRRLSFDLTGLPPTAKETADFLTDDSPNAYEKVVDRLLTSSAYGERMAMDWMDVARYADSDGYLDDKHREFSPWRDWVIKAFNENMPYDQFTTWQLAGDLLPDATKESILATAFNRLHRKNSEAGIVFEEYRVEAVADRAATVGKAFMGLTMECARCHDHKYDPISQKDFYKTFGFFNSTAEIGHAIYGPDQTPGPSLMLSTDEEDNLLSYIEGNLDGERKKLKEITDASEPAYQNWIANANVAQNLYESALKGLVAYYPLNEFRLKSKGIYETPNLAGNRQPAIAKEPDIKEGISGQGLFLNDFTKLTLPKKVGWFERTQPFSFALSVFPDELYEEAGLFYHCEEIRLGQKGYSLFLDNNRVKFVLAHSAPYNSIQVRTKKAIPEKEWSNIALTYDGSSSADGIKIYLNGERQDVEVLHDNLYKTILFRPNIHTYGFAGFTMGERQKMKLLKEGGFDDLKIYGRELAALEVLYAQDKVKAKKLVVDSRTPSNKKLLQDYFLKTQYKPIQETEQKLIVERNKLNQVQDSIPEIMVLGDMAEPRPTYVLDRGMYDAPTDEVAPGVPETILPFDESWPKNRLGLSKWLFDTDNPLTARVFVNRIWQMHFGNGIVKTSDDFGNQGSLPSHPELLDWLAVEFMESGWDIKKLHKLIVMSATYRQNSKINSELLDRDPENLLLARGPSFRLSAEMIRDNALAVSGLLVKKIGGPSVYPYQPEGLWDEISNKPWRYKYLQKPGEGLYRRSLYTVWKRSSPPPSLIVFDAPDRSFCTVDRRETSTPLQALVLLNDPQYLEAARVLAETIIEKDIDNKDKHLELAFKAVTGRTAETKERTVLKKFYDDEISRFSEQKKDALAYLDIGEIARNKALDPTLTASLATVINGIMNTSEGYTVR